MSRPEWLDDWTQGSDKGYKLDWTACRDLSLYVAELEQQNELQRAEIRTLRNYIVKTEIEADPNSLGYDEQPPQQSVTGESVKHWGKRVRNMVASTFGGSISDPALSLIIGEYEKYRAALQETQESQSGDTPK